jgi:3-deoxy-D-manno-octulosonate 8-phosphate phosphatase (KDO 8-P phosphatase)
MAIRLLALDVDGVMTDGTIIYSEHGEHLKAFHAQDGMGIKFLRKAGVEIAVISGRNSAPLNTRLDDLGITLRRLKCSNKTLALQELCRDVGCSLDEAAFMGDDLIDFYVMQAAGYCMAPANAVKEIRDIADYVTAASGGHGAVREACEHVADKLGVKLAQFMAPEHLV